MKIMKIKTRDIDIPYKDFKSNTIYDANLVEPDNKHDLDIKIFVEVGLYGMDLKYDDLYIFDIESNIKIYKSYDMFALYEEIKEYLITLYTLDLSNANKVTSNEIEKALNRFT